MTVGPFHEFGTWDNNHPSSHIRSGVVVISKQSPVVQTVRPNNICARSSMIKSFFLPLRAKTMATLDSDGHTYNPFTQNDIWGAPSQVNLTAETRQELPVGADDSALQQFSEPHLRNGRVIPGSDQSAEWHRANSVRSQRQTTNAIYLAAFGAIVAAALWYRLP